MSLDLVNDIVNHVKENKSVQHFISELSNYIENNSNITSKNEKENDLLSKDLTLYGEKITNKYRDQMLVERYNILQKYAEDTKEAGEMYYIYKESNNQEKAYDLCICENGKSHEVITKELESLPKGSNLGSVLRKQGNYFVLDAKATEVVGKEIDTMIHRKIEEQKEYLESRRMDGHIYEVGEKDSGRIWLYDLSYVTDGGIEGVEETEFPKDLYETAKEGDKFIYTDGQYKKYQE